MSSRPLSWPPSGPPGAPLTPGRVQTELGSGLARTTVTTILSRLHEKGLFSLAGSRRGFAYFPVQDPHGLTARRMHTELDLDGDRETALARFVAQLSPDANERLLRDLLESGEQLESGE